MPDENHKLVINTVTQHWFDGSPFSINELEKACGLSTSTVTRYLRRLTELGMIHHSPKGFMGRHYRVTDKWGSAHDVIESFVYAKVLGM